MEALRELAYIVAKNRLKKVGIIGNKPAAPTKVNEFYAGIVEGKFRTDDDAADYFYQKSKSYPGYQKLKSNLKSRLVDTVFFLQVKDGSKSERQKAYYTCYKDWSAAKILIGKGAWLAGASLCHKIVKLAKKYEFIGLILEVARELRLHYGTRIGDQKKYEQYNQLFKSYEKIWQTEIQAEELYTDLTINYVNNKSTKENLHEKAKHYYDLIKEQVKDYGSYRSHLCVN